MLWLDCPFNFAATFRKQQHQMIQQQQQQQHQMGQMGGPGRMGAQGHGSGQGQMGGQMRFNPPNQMFNSDSSAIHELYSGMQRGPRQPGMSSSVRPTGTFTPENPFHTQQQQQQKLQQQQQQRQMPMGNRGFAGPQFGQQANPQLNPGSYQNWHGKICFLVYALLIIVLSSS